jgi:hypothetical protein
VLSAYMRPLRLCESVRISSISIEAIPGLYIENQVLLFTPQRAVSFERDH